ncbi:MAG TPA: hydroxylamine reductase [Candidatus Hydrogenedentes bacterium]|nr:hydroxylamine reductase [Candidatus Hydrogenedentota bacterium]HOS03442.1 hydroxylamine reductase [Candidatus Hydrogenedentota bacterium]
MYCDQCEQTRNGKACTDVGVCGKNADVESLQKILLYGLKGMAAYKHHARRLGKTDPEVEAFIEDALFATVTNVNFDIASLLDLALECGRMNLRVMELLDAGHVETFGKPAPVEVKEGIQSGPGILVTGHDLVDLKDLLDQTAGTGINVYTHGEMLPAHMYPGLKQYPHLVGHYGGAWQRQLKEFEDFGGVILATTNCVQIPNPTFNTYLDRFFTTRVTAVPGATCLKGNDFSAVIRRAKEIGDLKPTPIKTSLIGFHHSVILGLADKVVEAVQSGAVKRFFLIGGCDGAEPGRNYFRDYARAVPEDAIILTLGCGKFRIRDYDYGAIGGIPRLLDMGQCNDAYGAIQVAIALAKAFNCGVNDLPLTLCISWFEQKAVAIFLTLLHLGVKGVRLGPALPAFVTPNVLAVLQEKYNVQPIGSDAKADVAAAMAGA